MPPLDELMRQIHANVDAVRDERRAAMPVVRTHEEARRREDGQVFVEELGAVIDVEDHLADFFYTPEAFVLRDQTLQQLSPARRRLFEGIGAQFRRGSRVLVIGAGGDVEPIRAFKAVPAARAPSSQRVKELAA